MQLLLCASVKYWARLLCQYYEHFQKQIFSSNTVHFKYFRQASVSILGYLCVHMFVKQYHTPKTLLVLWQQESKETLIPSICPWTTSVTFLYLSTLFVKKTFKLSPRETVTWFDLLAYQIPVLRGLNEARALHWAEEGLDTWFTAGVHMSAST